MDQMLFIAEMTLIYQVIGDKKDINPKCRIQDNSSSCNYLRPCYSPFLSPKHDPVSLLKLINIEKQEQSTREHNTMNDNMNYEEPLRFLPLLEHYRDVYYWKLMKTNILQNWNQDEVMS